MSSFDLHTLGPFWALEVQACKSGGATSNWDFTFASLGCYSVCVCESWLSSAYVPHIRTPWDCRDCSVCSHSVTHTARLLLFKATGWQDSKVPWWLFVCNVHIGWRKVACWLSLVAHRLTPTQLLPCTMLEVLSYSLFIGSLSSWTMSCCTNLVELTLLLDYSPKNFWHVHILYCNLSALTATCCVVRLWSPFLLSFLLCQRMYSVLVGQVSCTSCQTCTLPLVSSRTSPTAMFSSQSDVPSLFPCLPWDGKRFPLPPPLLYGWMFVPWFSRHVLLPLSLLDC